MIVFIASLLIFGLVMAGLGVGVWLRRDQRPLQGSCGGATCACRTAGAAPGTHCEHPSVEPGGTR